MRNHMRCGCEIVSKRAWRETAIAYAPKTETAHSGRCVGWRGASETLGRRRAAQLEGLENAARNFLDNRRGGFRKARNPKWARNDLEQGRIQSAEGVGRGAGGRRGKARSPQCGKARRRLQKRGSAWRPRRVPTGLAGASRCKATGLEWLPSERPILGLRGESNPSGKNTLRETERRRRAAILDT